MLQILHEILQESCKNFIFFQLGNEEEEEAEGSFRRGGRVVCESSHLF